MTFVPLSTTQRDSRGFCAVLTRSPSTTAGVFPRYCSRSQRTRPIQMQNTAFMAQTVLKMCLPLFDFGQRILYQERGFCQDRSSCVCFDRAFKRKNPHSWYKLYGKVGLSPLISPGSGVLLLCTSLTITYQYKRYCSSQVCGCVPWVTCPRPRDSSVAHVGEADHALLLGLASSSTCSSRAVMLLDSLPASTSTRTSRHSIGCYGT
eukprot:2168301-Rhodomonas_salina.1